MTIIIGADHGGFELKNSLIEYLQQKNIRVEDMGNYEHNPQDNYPEFASKVVKAVLSNPEQCLGIVICRSGVGVDIAANRFKGIRCCLGFNPLQVQKSREDDNINVLAIAADYITIDQAINIVNTFLNATPKTLQKYIKRIEELDSLSL